MCCLLIGHRARSDRSLFHQTPKYLLLMMLQSTLGPFLIRGSQVRVLEGVPRIRHAPACREMLRPAPVLFYVQTLHLPQLKARLHRHALKCNETNRLRAQNERRIWTPILSSLRNSGLRCLRRYEHPSLRSSRRPLKRRNFKDMRTTIVFRLVVSSSARWRSVLPVEKGK